MDKLTCHSRCGLLSIPVIELVTVTNPTRRREAHQLALVRWRVPCGNSDLFLAVVAVYLCHQLKPTCVPQRVRLKVSVNVSLRIAQLGMFLVIPFWGLHSSECFAWSALRDCTARDVSPCGIAQLGLFSWVVCFLPQPCRHLRPTGVHWILQVRPSSASFLRLTSLFVTRLTWLAQHQDPNKSFRLHR